MSQKLKMFGLSISLWYTVFSFLTCNPSAPGNGMLPREISETDYKALKEELKSERDSLSMVLAGLNESDDETEFLEKSRKILRTHLEDDLIPCWYGTEWDFNGISQVPGKGMIACGYFVSTLLRDVGYDLERYKLAQQASLNIVRSLSPKEHRRDWSGISTSTLAERIQEMKEGFYVVGLDNHVGFLFHDDDGSVWFIHSSYMDPVAVVRELATDSEPLAASNRYVVGYLESDWLIRKWLNREKIATIKS